jgi:2-haloacid dehalogenase
MGSTPTAPKLVTFDVYSALLDIEGSLTPVLGKALGLADDEARPLVRDWRARQMARAAASNSLNRGRTSFRAATRMALDAVLARRGASLDETARHDLVMAWDAMSPWPEARDVIAQVKALGYPVAILSNGDQDMLDAVAGLFEGGFDHVLSSETAGWYKPHPAVYALPSERLGVAKADTLHVAGGAMDVLGAVAAEMPCLWSNRMADVPLDPAFLPDYEVADLRGLLEVLESAA